MNHKTTKIPCEIIQDLMPVYVDGLTSDTTDREIREHLEECETCREMYRRMKKEINGDGTEKEGEKAEIDYLKKVRKRNVRNVILGAAVVFLIMISVFFVKLFIIGHPSKSYQVTYVNVNGSQVNVGGVMYEPASVFSGYKLKKQKDGTEKLVVYVALPSFWNRNGDFNLELGLPDNGKDLEVNGITIKGDGTVISAMANSLYKSRNPYIGDASAGGKLAGALRISQELGSFTNELQTSKEPYGWTLNFEESTSNSAVFEERMKAYACMLIALTDNLEQVSWSYTVELKDGPVKRTGTITQEECTAMAGAPIKSFAESPQSVQQLLGKLEISK